MPGRLTPPMPDRLSPQWRISALTSVPAAWPGAGWTTSPAGLSMTSRCVVLEDDVERQVLAGDRRVLGRRHGERDRCALGDPRRRIARLGAVDRHLTGLDQRLQPRARKGEPARRGRLAEKPVEPLAAFAGADGAGEPRRPPQRRAERRFRGSAAIAWDFLGAA